jgi:hypothetical protein
MVLRTRASGYVSGKLDGKLGKVQTQPQQSGAVVASRRQLSDAFLGTLLTHKVDDNDTEMVLSDAFLGTLAMNRVQVKRALA